MNDNLRPDYIYYDLLKKIEEDYKNGNINKEERKIMIDKATLDEIEKPKLKLQPVLSQ